MDFFEYNYLETKESTGKMLTYTRLRSFSTKLFRFLELCLALLLFLWTFNRLPFAVRISGEFLRWMGGVIASPLFVFVLCNVIIATLIAESGRFFGEIPAANNADSELYEELIKNSENRCPESLSENAPSLTPPLSHATEEIVYQDKEIIISQANNAIAYTPQHGVAAEDDRFSANSDSDSDSDLDTPRVYRRTKSEKLEREKAKAKYLRRSETEKCRSLVRTGGEDLCTEEELSDEEFQRTVDEFIAKHLMFRRQESLAFVRQSQTLIGELDPN